MRSPRRWTAALGLGAVLLGLGACTTPAAPGPSSPSTPGRVTPTGSYRLEMVTHGAAGDTFFDIIRRGADDAAANTGVTYTYSSSGDATEQAQLMLQAIERHPDGLAVSIPNAAAAREVLLHAKASGVPIAMFNAGAQDWQEFGAIGYFGQDESIAGEAAGARLAAAGVRKALCVVHSQGQSQLEARCDGLIRGFTGGAVERLYVTGTDQSAVRTAITTKLKDDPAVDAVVTLGAPFALTAVTSVAEAGSGASVYTFDTNAEVVEAIRAGRIQWAIDQQPYLQGYLAIESLVLYLRNGNTIGGGQMTLTGPSFVDPGNVESVAAYAEAGTR